MRLTFAALIVSFSLGSIAAAQSEDAGQACKDESVAYEKRIAACEGYVSLADTDRIRANRLVYLGEAHADSEVWDKALEAYGQALALRPDYPFALSNQAIAFRNLDRLDKALTATARLLEIEPEDAWNHYYHGEILRRLKRYDEAIAYFDSALNLRPEYYWPLYRKAFILDYNFQRYAQAGELYARALEIEPFDIRVNQRAYQAFRDADLPDRAAYYARIHYTLNPNQLTTRDWLNSYTGEVQPPDLAPMPWIAPEPGRSVKYFQVLTTIDARDAIEQAIEDLVVFFGGEPYPKPLDARFYVQTIIGLRGDTVDWERDIPNTRGEEDLAAMTAPPVGLYRGLFPREAQPLGEKSPLVLAQFIDPVPADIWPLTVGNSASGSAKYTVYCPDEISIPGLMMGCLEGIESVDLGALDWQISTERTERVHVPLGLFDTYVVHYKQEGKITILGKSRPFNMELRFWISPQLNAWVRREAIAGELIVLDQATAIEEN